MSPPRRISPAARERRALLFDSLAAIAVAALVLSLAAGLGVVAVIGLPLLLIGLLWIASERMLAALRRRRS